MPRARRAVQAGPSVPPLPHRDRRRRDRPPGRQLGRPLGSQLGGASDMLPRGISPPPRPSAPPLPPPPPPPPRPACHCCRCRCSRCRVRTRSTASDRLAASRATSTCAAPSPPLHPLHLPQPITCCNLSLPATRSPPPPPATGASMRRQHAAPPPWPPPLPRCSRWCRRVLRVYSDACTLTRCLHRVSHIAPTTLHPPCTDLAPTWPHACRTHPELSQAISPISPLYLPYISRALAGAPHRPGGNGRRALRRGERRLGVRGRALAAHLELPPRPRPPCSRHGSRARRAVRRARRTQEGAAPRAGGGSGARREAVAAPYGVGGRAR